MKPEQLFPSERPERMTDPFGDPTIYRPPMKERRAALARRSDPEESHAAARSVTDLTGKQQAVLACLRFVDRPVTDFDLAGFYDHHREDEGWPEQSPSGLRTRRSELANRRLIARDGIGILPTGRKSARWSLTDDGRSLR